MPVTPARFADLERFFTQRGAPSYCWCASHRFRNAHEMTRDDKRGAMRSLAKRSPIGVLAYEDGEPVGWCSVAPRASYEKLERSRVMPRVGDAETWTILCFFVPRAHRGEGVAQALLAGAVEYARSEGAAEVEAYPYDAAGITATHMGRAALYSAAGFAPDVGRRWVLRF